MLFSITFCYCGPTEFPKLHLMSFSQFRQIAEYQILVTKYIPNQIILINTCTFTVLLHTDCKVYYLFA